MEHLQSKSENDSSDSESLTKDSTPLKALLQILATPDHEDVDLNVSDPDLRMNTIVTTFGILCSVAALIVSVCRSLAVKAIVVSLIMPATALVMALLRLFIMAGTASQQKGSLLVQYFVGTMACLFLAYLGELIYELYDAYTQEKNQLWFWLGLSVYLGVMAFSLYQFDQLSKRLNDSDEKSKKFAPGKSPTKSPATGHKEPVTPAHYDPDAYARLLSPKGTPVKE